jgi:hypothetical protein
MMVMLSTSPPASPYTPTVRYSKPYHDAVAGQRDVMRRLQKASDKDAAMLLKSFATLEMLKLRLKMKPAPKAIDVTKIKKGSNIPTVD